MSSQMPAIQFATLHSLHQNAQPLEFTLQDDVCTIGRSSMCDVVVTQQKTVSRLHAKIEREGPRYILSDANSANGTFVNERRIFEPHLLQDEDMIGLGQPQPLLRFSDPDPTDVVATSSINYDARRMQFSLSRQYIDLTPNEFRFLHHLYQHQGDVCTRESCIVAVWKQQYNPDLDNNALERLVSNLRAKIRQLDPDVDPAEIIKTRRGFGYEFII